MKYFLPQTSRGRDILQYIKEITQEEDMVEFIHAYQEYLSHQIGKPEHDRRVIERTIFYMFGFLTGIGEKSATGKINTWKKIINQELYNKQEENTEGEHRLIEL